MSAPTLDRDAASTVRSRSIPGHRRSRLAGVVLAAALGLAACGGSSAGTVDKGGLDLPTTSVSIPPDAQRNITPGAFCTPQGATGVTSRNVLMTCKPSADDTRNRWRSN